MELNKIQKEFDRLFDENISKGLVIKAPRQVGKTTYILDKAKRLADAGSKVLIVTPRQDSMKHMKSQMGIHNDMIEVLCTSMLKPLQAWSIKRDYTFYDEYITSEMSEDPVPNTFKIGSGTRNVFTFDASWCPNNMLKFIEEFKSESEEQWLREFNSGVIENGTK